MSAAREVVLILPVLEPAGAERIVAELARRLPAHGFATRVICLEDERAAVGAELTAAGVPVTGLRLSRRRSLACAKALLAVLSVQRPLILHAHLFHANIAARLALARLPAAERVALPLLCNVHVAERRFRPWQFALDRFTARYARAEICVSRAVAEFQREQTGLPAEFFRVVENGIDLQRFTPGGSQHSNAPVVLSVGRLDAQKDYATLLRAWKIVEVAHPTAHLEIAGNGPERDNLLGLIAAQKLQRAKLTGFIADVPLFLRRGAVYVQPSAWEGFGLSVAEAMACELPVIVSDADSLPELVRGGVAGVVVPKGDASGFAAAILDLLQDRACAHSLARAAREEALARFSVERMVAQYAEIYRGLS